jgi:hypothetical protein
MTRVAASAEMELAHTSNTSAKFAFGGSLMAAARAAAVEFSFNMRRMLWDSLTGVWTTVFMKHSLINQSLWLTLHGVRAWWLR